MFLETVETVGFLILEVCDTITETTVCGII